jgi:hypothetical protein
MYFKNHKIRVRSPRLPQSGTPRSDYRSDFTVLLKEVGPPNCTRSFDFTPLNPDRILEWLANCPEDERSTSFEDILPSIDCPTPDIPSPVLTREMASAAARAILDSLRQNTFPIELSSGTDPLSEFIAEKLLDRICMM